MDKDYYGIIPKVQHKVVLLEKEKKSMKFLNKIVCLFLRHKWEDLHDDNRDEIHPGTATKSRIICKRCGRYMRFKSKVRWKSR